MGIQGLSKFLRDKYPQVIEVCHLSEFAYKKIAVDLSVYLYKYMAVNNKNSRPNAWLQSFLSLVSVLRKNNIHCIFIYDGKAPKQKEKEQQRRKDDRDKRELKMHELEIAMDNYRDFGRIDKALQDFIDRRSKKFKKLIGEGINMKLVEKDVEEYLKGNVPSVTKEQVDTTKRLFTILKIPFCTAPEEAEAMCSKLARINKVEAVLSADTDILTYSSPKFLFDINTKDQTCSLIEINNLLKEMEWTRKQFIDFCIMCGTDYNKNIKGIGPAKAYSLMNEYGSLEKIEEETELDTSILDFREVRKLFYYPKSKKIDIPYCGKPNFTKLREFLTANNIHTYDETIEKSFGAVEIVIEE